MSGGHTPGHRRIVVYSGFTLKGGQSYCQNRTFQCRIPIKLELTAYDFVIG